MLSHLKGQFETEIHHTGQIKNKYQADITRLDAQISEQNKYIALEQNKYFEENLQTIETLEKEIGNDKLLGNDTDLQKQIKEYKADAKINQFNKEFTELQTKTDKTTEDFDKIKQQASKLKEELTKWSQEEGVSDEYKRMLQSKIDTMQNNIVKITQMQADNTVSNIDTQLKALQNESHLINVAENDVKNLKEKAQNLKDELQNLCNTEGTPDETKAVLETKIQTLKDKISDITKAQKTMPFKGSEIKMKNIDIKETLPRYIKMLETGKFSTGNISIKENGTVEVYDEKKDSQRFTVDDILPKPMQKLSENEKTFIKKYIVGIMMSMKSSPSGKVRLESILKNEEYTKNLITSASVAAYSKMLSLTKGKVTDKSKQAALDNYSIYAYAGDVKNPDATKYGLNVSINLGDGANANLQSAATMISSLANNSKLKNGEVEWLKSEAAAHLFLSAYVIGGEETKDRPAFDLMKYILDSAETGKLLKEYEEKADKKEQKIVKESKESAAIDKKSDEKDSKNASRIKAKDIRQFREILTKIYTANKDMFAETLTVGTKQVVEGKTVEAEEKAEKPEVEIDNQVKQEEIEKKTEQVAESIDNSNDVTGAEI